ncbi:DNA-binding protein [Paraburkholderia fungorum]|uniref:DNA-binding protein n=1 Tax=Paraburkholderia fungorum TaxID=134537 RepID=UPI00402B155B
MTNDEFNQKISAFRADLYARGETIQAFCDRKDLNYQAMFHVMRGIGKGKRGESHKVYVALGLKPDPAAN